MAEIILNMFTKIVRNIRILWILKLEISFLHNLQ